MKARPFLLFTSLLLATNASAQQCFTPANGASKPFVSFLDHIVENNENSGWKDYYICAPAFNPAYALTLEKEQLVYKKITDIDWSERKQEHSYKTARWTLPINHGEWRVLCDLLDNATITANYYSYRIGIDGVTYYLGSCGRLVSSWCPTKGTLPYRTIEALDSICFAVASDDTALFHRQLTVCQSLTSEYRLQYPMSYFYPTVSRSRYYSKSKGNRYSVSLDCNYRLKVTQYIDTNVSFEDLHFEAGPLGDSMAVWRCQLFLNEQENGIHIFLSDTSGMRCRIDNDGQVTMIVPKERLNRQILFDASHLSKGYYELSSDGQWLAIPEKRYKWWPDYFSL